MLRVQVIACKVFDVMSDQVVRIEYDLQIPVLPCLHLSESFLTRPISVVGSLTH